MADNKKKVDKDVDRLSSINDIVNGLIYGTNRDIHRDTMNTTKRIKDNIRKLNLNVSKNTGSNVIEFFNRMNSEVEKQNSKNNQAGQNRELTDLDKMIHDPDSSLINDLFYYERNRINLYENYKLIYDYIPQVAQALDTYVDNILSPDDFTKNSFNLYYNDQIISEVNNKNIMNNLDSLTNKYEIDIISKEIIRDTLKLGDQFVAVLNIGKEIDKMLSEESEELFKFSRNEEEDITTYNDLTVSDVLLEDREASIFKEMFSDEYKESKKNKSKPNKKEEELISINEVKKEISNMINNNIEFSHNASVLAEGTKKLQKDFLYNGVSKEKKKKKDFKLNGNVLKVLEPKRVLKISQDGMNYGYYYIEKIENEKFGNSLSKKNYVNFNNVSGQVSDEQGDAKRKLIVNTFAKNISKKIDKDFIKNNSEFKDIIYELLKQEYLINGKVRIVYLSPDEVVHFAVNKEDSYGQSVFRKILFSAKIYLSVLTSTLMQKLVRSPDKRVFYVDVGLDKDIEATIQSFVRDIKTREVKMGDLKDINRVINNTGTFHDLFIPVINGERPVEFDELTGTSADMDDSFLEYLRKTMISGMGVPSSFLNYTEDINFARSLAMENGKFVRSVIVFQKVFGEGFSKIYRKLYENEYITNIKENDKKKKKKKDDEIEENKNEQVVLNGIEARFPPPSSLNLTNISDQISNSERIVEYITNTLMGSRASDENKKHFQKLVAKDLIPSVDWKKYDELLEKAKMSKTKEDLEGNDEEEDSGGSW